LNQSAALRAFGLIVFLSRFAAKSFVTQAQIEGTHGNPTLPEIEATCPVSAFIKH
jgi:hypothetical protein